MGKGAQELKPIDGKFDVLPPEAAARLRNLRYEAGARRDVSVTAMPDEDGDYCSIDDRPTGGSR
jgi:hypothetical protein